MKPIIMMVFLLIAGMLSSISMLHAQQNAGFTYQAVARDANGTILVNSSINLNFEIFQGLPTTGNSPIYSQTVANQVTNTYGLVNLIIGENSSQFAQIDWSLGPHYCLVSLNGAPVDTMPFTPVAYSKYSEISQRALVDQVDDADADPTNEAQTLTKSGNTVTLSSAGGNGGGSFVDAIADADADPTNEAQTLTKSGNTVTLSSAGGIGGGSFVDAVNDSDADPTNELQGLSLTGNTLSLTNNAGSSSINLPLSSYVAGNGINIISNTITNTAPSNWTMSSSDVYRAAGKVGIGTSSPSVTLDVRGIIDLRNQLRIKNSSGQERILYSITTAGYGNGDYLGANGSLNVRIGARSNSATGKNLGKVSVYDDAGNLRGSIFSEEGAWNGAGRVITNGINGSANVELGVDAHNTSGRSRGAIRVWDEYGNLGVRLGVDALGRGTITAYGSNGAAGGGIKNFSMPHPTKADKQIVYACIEGPEAAAYERGTVQLVNGKAEVLFSEHFEIVVNPSTMTIMTSPWSAEAKGLAVVERTATGFTIKELDEGTGTYKVDWEVKAVRKGWEDYQAIRDRELETNVSSANQ